MYFSCTANIIKLLYSESHKNMFKLKVWKKFHKKFTPLILGISCVWESPVYSGIWTYYWWFWWIFDQMYVFFQFHYCLREVVTSPILTRFENFDMFWKAMIPIRSFLILLTLSGPVVVPKTIDEVGWISTKSICTTLLLRPTADTKQPKFHNWI